MTGLYYYLHCQKSNEVCQIHMPAWSKGRVTSVGDAAHTKSFPGAMGTSLALQGAASLTKALFFQVVITMLLLRSTTSRTNLASKAWKQE